MSMLAASSVRSRTASAIGFFGLLRLSISAHGLFLAIMALYLSAFVALIRVNSGVQYADFWQLVLGFSILSFPLMIFGVFFTRLYHIAVHVKPERPLPALIKDVARFFSSAPRMAQGLPMVAIMVLFMYVFVEIKASIPALNPFSWDSALEHADRLIHFGYAPWRLMQPVLGYAPVSFILNLNYCGWFLVMWVVWVYFAFLEGSSELRTRFFFTFFTAWIIGGGIMAVVFSSVGPCFYGRLGLTPDPYADLVTYLHQANEVLPIWAVPVQDLLWKGFDGSALTEGISAMPSMHVGTATLFALSAWQINRTFGKILAVHAVLILIGSVALAWHYAVDGYVAAALTFVLWRISAPVARWWHRQAPQADFAEAVGSEA